ncbi:hypothetical protein ABL78_4176 [Leptomonas seymouri]|uniref:Uncharacterized protein n=1 Tax=Leptomonas seymouri TaxID=5684 RepID=A0A0N0P5R1_LEPSE|nr:hypothetical protein ABL78_4176 [Leptomonas seymouri]|eukprot:KPI86759.1 hypothetical protein ABL78_4176 [Leptomonas seymouri]
MQSPFRAYTLLSVCVIVFLVLGIVARSIPAVERPFQTKFKTLSQACYGVLEDKCPSNSPSRVDCLELNFEDNDSHECRLWVGWRTICRVYVEMRLIPKGLCNFTAEEATPTLVRKCLTTVEKTELPAMCYDNPYYKSLKVHGRRQMDDADDL